MPLTKAWFPLRYHPQQAQLWRTKAKRVAILAGRGSGKTEIARRYAVRMLSVRKPWGDPLYAYCLPVYKQAKRIAWAKLKALVPPEWLDGPPSESELIIRTKFGSSLHVVGMDKPARIEGDQWDGVFLDEICDQKPSAFKLSVAPALTHRDGFCWQFGVPKRFGPNATTFLATFDKYATGEEGPRYQAFSWPSTDILSPEQMAEAARETDPKDYAEQFLAQRQELGGRVFYAFDPVQNVTDQVCYHPDELLVIGSDFNITPMAWSISHFKANGDVHTFDEIWLRDTNTQATLDELYRRYGEHRSGFLFIGDATAKARKTSASESDYLQIVNDHRFELATVRYPKSNPSRYDRFAACNKICKNALGERHAFVHPRCKHLIWDLTNRAYAENGRDTNDTHPDAGHMTDAWGYAVYYLKPLVEETSEDGRMLIEKDW